MPVNKSLKLKLLFILTILTSLISSIMYHHYQIKNPSTLEITINDDSNKIDCIEVFFNNVYETSWRDCNGDSNKYYFHNIPNSIKNIRVDFGSKPNISFSIQEMIFISSGIEKTIDVKNLLLWNKDQLIIKDDKFITNGNDSKILGNIEFESSQQKYNLLIFIIPIIAFTSILFIQIIKNGITFKIAEEMLIILGFSFGFISAFPGHTNFDELYTLGEYFREKISDMHPPMQMLFTGMFIKAGNFIGIMPIISMAFILIIQLLIYWWSIKVITNLIDNSILKIIFLAILALSPIGLVYSGHIGKDSQMAIALLFSFTLIITGNNEKRLILILMAIFPIFYAYTIRANGPAAVLPILFYWTISIISHLNIKKYTIFKSFCTFIFTLLFINIINNVIVRTNVKIYCCGGVQLIMTPVYDLMGVSKTLQKNLVPEYLYIDKYDLTDINKNFDSTYINWDGLIQANYKHLIPVLKLWLAMAKEHPSELIEHRLNTLKYFFGLQMSPPAFPYMSGFYSEINKTGKSNVTYRLVEEYKSIEPYLLLKHSFELYFSKTASFPFYRYWIYLFCNLILFVYIVKNKIKVSSSVYILTFSSILYTLPYLVIANSAQFRYVYWSVLSFYIIFFINIDKIMLHKKTKEFKG